MGTPNYMPPGGQPLSPYWQQDQQWPAPQPPPVGLGQIGHQAPVGPIDTGAAHAAAFGKAKDDAAMTAQSAMTGLQGILSQRGMGGAGYEGGQIGHVLGQEANQMGAASRAEAQSEADRSQRTAEFNANSAITQRGQDQSAQATAYQGAIQQRGQDLQDRQNNQQHELQRQVNRQRILQEALHGLMQAY